MSSNPWDTNNVYGADLAGTMTAPDPPTQPPITLQESLMSPADRLGAIQPNLMQQQQGPEAAIQNYTVNAKTGMVKLEMPQGALAEVMGQLTDLKTMKAAAMARVTQLQQQERSGSPLLDALSQFAGNMAANDPTMPGWVRALGKTNLAMGPQGIKAERMAQENRVLQLGQSQAQVAQILSQDQRAERQLGLQEKSFEAAQADKQATRVEARVKDTLSRYKDEVDKGRPVDPMLIATELVSGGLSPERAIAAATQMQKQSETNKAEIEATRGAELKTKQELETYKSALSLRNDLTVEGKKEAFKWAELGFNRDSKLAEISAAAAAKTAGERKLTPAARSTLIQINALDEKLDNLYERFSKFSIASGPVMGRLGTAAEYAVPDSKWAAERRAIRSELQRFVAQYVKAVQGGGNTISNKDVENAAKSLPNVNVSVTQFKALVDSIKDEGQYQRNVMHRAYEADWEGKDKNLLGAFSSAGMASGPPKVPNGWKIEVVK